MANWWDKNLTDKQKFRLQEPKDPSLLDVVSTVPNPVGDVASGLLAAQDLSKGNYGTAALNSLGLLPFIPSMGAVVKNVGKEVNAYPLAPAGTRYEEYSGNLTYMTPDEYLRNVRPLTLDESSLDNIADLKRHVESGGKLDPLAIYPSGKEDGRHRAYLAKELGINQVPVALHGRTKYEIQQATAQKNAALPVAEGGLGLPATNTAMDRAKAMGFNTGKKWLHGTRDDFGEFSRTKDIGYHFGDKWQANDRAGAGYESNVIPVYLKNDNIINTDDVYGASSTFPIYGNLVDKGHISQNEVDNIFQNVIRADHDKALSNLLKSKNYGGIEYDNMVEGIRTNLRKNGDKNTARIVLDSSQIRSPNAAFDPFRRNEADILAGVAPLAVGSLLGLNTYNNMQDKPKKEIKKTK